MKKLRVFNLFVLLSALHPLSSSFACMKGPICPPVCRIKCEPNAVPQSSDVPKELLGSYLIVSTVCNLTGSIRAGERIEFTGNGQWIMIGNPMIGSSRPVSLSQVSFVNGYVRVSRQRITESDSGENCVFQKL